ncbi:hypothetical protein GCG54_00008836 [Colletotrichum gloeosporioides]|uniref:Uncharacterized protein n=1 Tax=Colletotrichum gloeosporioides TaxID=474922 RepID=A0A8H4FNI1_COLGL|nr:uncharacterized protein GCG54_00008836 [Colletotrichum gloeosporioides]KAF3807379.1 hypothetical protein GCG54_00008836 [Colletotrichum gloeosporioides]
MPTVIRPHPEVVGKCAYTPSPNRDFFKQISAEDQSRESVQTSVSGAHDGTILRSDDVWLDVLVQVSFFVNGPGRAEALRNHFVAHEGQRFLVVRIGSGQAVNSFDMETITEHFVILLREHQPGRLDAADL